LLHHSGHPSTVLPLLRIRAIRIRCEKQVSLPIPAPRTNSIRSFARTRCLPRKRKRGNSSSRPFACILFPRARAFRGCGPKKIGKAFPASPLVKFHFVMIAFSLPYSLIITGKLRFLILRRLFSNLATFPAFEQLTEFSLPASSRQNRLLACLASSRVLCSSSGPHAFACVTPKASPGAPFPLICSSAPWYTTPKLFRLLGPCLSRAPSSFPIRESPSAPRRDPNTGS